MSSHNRRRSESAARTESRNNLTRTNSQAINALSQEQIEDFREVFHLFDKDGDNSIAVVELRTAMKSLGLNPTEEEVKEMISEVDVDGSGAIDFQEFLALMARSTTDVVIEQQLKEAFAVFDTNGDSFISKDELRDGIARLIKQTLTNEEAEEIIIESKYDEDQDGKISFDEFVEFMCIR
eukprot:NODE_1785_length_757_cov_233.840395_g1387_i0.p1 GENE.NODE_1785_length_757_cov_233.840395_g1387_i0~~NODE_1785_length_757_cov_233.840395_g1387_i0.p1  ORF type:complete len:198 (-),score=61.37 NODE_1785_length_757_cov_233.840395_g1387_i0:162-701(-)